MIGHLIRPLAYEVHPYRWPTIGKDLSHIEQATLEEVKSSFTAFMHLIMPCLPLPEIYHGKKLFD